MSGDDSSTRLIMIIMVVVAILIIIHSAWSLWLIQRVIGDECDCSGTTDSDLMCLKVFHIIMLVIGIFLALYVIWCITAPGMYDSYEERSPSRDYGRIRERFNTEDI